MLLSYSFKLHYGWQRRTSFNRLFLHYFNDVNGFEQWKDKLVINIWYKLKSKSTL